MNYRIACTVSFLLMALFGESAVELTDPNSS
jgi:hypothetical protein